MTYRPKLPGVCNCVYPKGGRPVQIINGWGDVVRTYISRCKRCKGRIQK